MTLGSWDLEAQYLDDEYLSGTMPVLYADDPDTAEAAMALNPVQLKKDIEKLQKVFFLPESLDKEEALGVIRKPRMGAASFDWKDANLERIFEAAPSAAPSGLIKIIILF